MADKGLKLSEVSNINEEEKQKNISENNLKIEKKEEGEKNVIKIENKEDNTNQSTLISIDSKIEEKKEDKKEVKIQKTYENNKCISPEFFSISYISEYACMNCGYIPTPNSAYEKICCAKILCEECFNEFTKGETKCEKCEKEKVEFRKIKDKNKSLYKILKNLNIKCPFKCDWNGKFSDLEKHSFECKFGKRHCIYKLIGCTFAGINEKVKEHEDKSEHEHFEMALKFIKENKIEKTKIKFELGYKIKVNCHPHEMMYMTSFDWCCDGRKLPHGCYGYSQDTVFPMTKARFRCRQCDFDLCEKCVVHYFV